MRPVHCVRLRYPNKNSMRQGIICTPGHYLHAMILQELNQLTQAREALRRVLYLQPDMIMAIYTLANLEQQQGHRREAQRHFDNAFRILSMHEDDSLIPHSEGLYAGQLRELLMQLRVEG